MGQVERRATTAGRAALRPGRLLAAALAGTLLACSPAPARDLDAIEASGRLVALFPYDSTTYFLYRGEPMGYEYELLRRFAADRELDLEVVPVEERGRLLARLRAGEGDVAGGRLLPELLEADDVAWSEGLYGTRLAVVQRAVAGGAPEEMLAARRIESPDDLAGRTVHAPSGSATFERLLEVADEISGDVEIVEVGPQVSAETLIRRVSRGELELTASQRNLAQLKKSYFRNILVRPARGPEREVAFAVSEGARALHAALDAWLLDPENEPLLEELYYKYFVDRRGYRERVASSYLTSTTGRLSRFDELIRREAERLGWDWRLMASMVYQESRFDPGARSWAGAEGLLQLMPATAEAYGVEEPSDPAQSLRGGTELLAWLDDYWADEIPEPDERLLFVLASFNVGQGHVADARRLARAEGDDPDRWEDVAGWLIQKSRRVVYSRPEVRYGFCRGLEPVTYVARVMERYAHYRHFVPAEPEAASEPAAEAG